MNDRPDHPVYLRPVAKSDREAFIAAMRASAALHEPWIHPPTTRDLFNRYVRRLRRDDHVGLLVLERASGAIAGCFNINHIVGGSSLSGSLGYYAAAPYAGRGYMRMGMEQLIAYAIKNLGLHRLEANIQPGNHRSIALVRRCGFVKEGLSRDFLFIDGAWRDHERWAYVDPRRSLACKHRQPWLPGRPW